MIKALPTICILFLTTLVSYAQPLSFHANIRAGASDFIGSEHITRAHSTNLSYGGAIEVHYQRASSKLGFISGIEFQHISSLENFIFTDETGSTMGTGKVPWSSRQLLVPALLKTSLNPSKRAFFFVGPSLAYTLQARKKVESSQAGSNEETLIIDFTEDVKPIYIYGNLGFEFHLLQTKNLQLNGQIRYQVGLSGYLKDRNDYAGLHALTFALSMPITRR